MTVIPLLLFQILLAIASPRASTSPSWVAFRRHHVDSAKNKTVRPSWYAAEKKMVQGDGEAQRRERDGGAGR